MALPWDEVLAIYYRSCFLRFCKILLPKVCLLTLGWAIPSDIICDSGFKLLRSRQTAGISRIHVQRKKRPMLWHNGICRASKLISWYPLTWFIIYVIKISQNRDIHTSLQTQKDPVKNVNLVKLNIITFPPRQARSAPNLKQLKTCPKKQTNTPYTEGKLCYLR